MSTSLITVGIQNNSIDLNDNEYIKVRSYYYNNNRELIHNETV